MSKVKKFVKIFLGLPLTIAALFFIGKILAESLPLISAHLAKANIFLILAGLFFMMIFFLVRAIAWSKVLNFFGNTDKTILDAVYSYSAAETKRYIPGNIFSFISRVQKFETKSLSKSVLIKALVLESVVMVISACVVSIPAVFGLIKLNNLFPIAVITGALVLLLVTFQKYKSFFLSFFPKSKVSSYLEVIFISSIAWLCFGLGNYFFLVAVFPTDPNLIYKLASSFVLAWIVGYLTFVAPMGLGVREAAVIFLLEPFLPSYAAAASAIFTRILFIFSEVIFLSCSFLLHKFDKYERIIKKNTPIIIVLCFALLYSFYFSFASILRHLKFYSGKFDLGNMENTIWNTLNGNFFIFSNPDGANELSRLSAHADFILLAFVPIYAVFPSVNVLLIAQTLIIALGGFFVYLISKSILKSEKLSVLFALSYYLNFYVQEQNIFDFHSVSLATTFLLASFFFIFRKRFGVAILFLTLSALTKENVYLVTAIFGGYMYLMGRKLLGSAVFIASILVFVLLMTIFIPNARGGEHFALDYLSYLGSTPFEIILSPILKPEAFFGRVFSTDTLEYLKYTFMPVGYLSFLAPQYLIFMIPEFFINILSDNPNLRSIQYHYGAVLVPFVYISAIYGVKKLRKKLNELLVVSILLGFTVYSFWLYSPLPGTKNSDIAFLNTAPNSQEIRNRLKEIPRDASVSASNSIAAHLVQREKIYVLPNGIDFVDYLVFYKTDMELYYELASNENFTNVYDSNGLLILKRISSPYRDYSP